MDYCDVVLITRCNFYFALQNVWFIERCLDSNGKRWHLLISLGTQFNKNWVRIRTAKKQHQTYHKLLDVIWFTQGVMLGLKLWVIPPLCPSNRARLHPNEELKVSFIISKRGCAPVVGAATSLGRDTVASALLVFVLSALLAEDDVAVPRLFFRVPMLPSQRFLAAQAPSSVYRWSWAASRSAGWWLAGAYRPSAVWEQAATQRLRWPAVHGKFPGFLQ